MELLYPGYYQILSTCSFMGLVVTCLRYDLVVRGQGALTTRYDLVVRGQGAPTTRYDLVVRGQDAPTTRYDLVVRGEGALTTRYDLVVRGEGPDHPIRPCSTGSGCPDHPIQPCSTESGCPDHPIIMLIQHSRSFRPAATQRERKVMSRSCSIRFATNNFIRIVQNTIMIINNPDNI